MDTGNPFFSIGLGAAVAHKPSPRRGVRKTGTPNKQPSTAQSGGDAANGHYGSAGGFSFDFSNPAAGTGNRAFTELDGNRDPLRPDFAASRKAVASEAANPSIKPNDFSSWASTLNGITANAYASPGTGMAAPGPFAASQQGHVASRFQPSQQAPQGFMPSKPSTHCGPAGAAAAGASGPRNAEARAGHVSSGFCFGKPGPESPGSKAAGRHAQPSSPAKVAAAAAARHSNPSSPPAPAPQAAAAASHAAPSFPFAASNSSSSAGPAAGAQATPGPCFATTTGGVYQPDPSPEPMSTSTPWQGPSRGFGTPFSAVPMETTGGPVLRAGTAAAAEDDDETEPVKRLFDTPGLAGISPGDSSIKGSEESSFSFQIGKTELPVCRVALQDASYRSLLFRCAGFCSLWACVVRPKPPCGVHSCCLHLESVLAMVAAWHKVTVQDQGSRKGGMTLIVLDIHGLHHQVVELSRHGGMC